MLSPLKEEPGEDDHTGPASSVALSDDDNCLSSALFTSEKHKRNVTGLVSRMDSVFRTSDSSRISHTHKYRYSELYHLAQYQSRIPNT